MGGKNKQKANVTKTESATKAKTDAKDTSSTADQVSDRNGKKAEVVATEVVRLFDAVVECLKIYLFLLSSSDLDHVNAAAEKLMVDVANLQIRVKTHKPSSSQSVDAKKTPKSLEPPGDGQENRSKEEVKAERKIKATEAKARKAAAAEMKKATKQSSAVTSTVREATKKLQGQEGRHLKPVRAEEQRQKQHASAGTLMKDPDLPGDFRAWQPFRTVYFDLRTKDEESEEGPSRHQSICEQAAPNIHPSFLEFASRCEAKHIAGIDGICIAFVQSFKQFLSSYMVSPNQTISRDLDQAIRQQLSYLTESGKHSFPLALGNLIRQVKKEITELPESISEEEGKKYLQQWLDDLLQQNFELALQAISSFCIKKLKNTLFVLTYSWCPVVERILLDAHEEELHFHVHVLDSPIEPRGKQLVKTLCERKIPCTYGMLSSVGYLINECQLVLLGCSAILSNGFAVAERGTSQVAQVACACNIPVLIAAQTYKFVDRVQSFSRGVHELSALLGERQEAVPADLITAVITELRIVPPSSAPAVLKAKQLAREPFEMTLYLLNQWKNQPGGAQDATAFLLALQSDRSSMREKELIIEALDDWDVLTPTWFEVADYLSVIEGLHEDERFKQRYLAALLASKVAYCLGDYNGALQLALAAEDKFQLTPRPPSPLVGSQDEQYVNKMIEHALDTYKQAKRNEDKIDPRLEKLINRLFERNMKRRELRYVIGLALDTRRTDMILAAIKATDDQATLLTETVTKVLESQMDRAFRSIVLDLLLRLFAELEEPDFVSMCQCLIKLEKPDDVADILQRLVSNKNDNGVLLAYQIAFDLYENASQQFISKIEQSLMGSTSAQASTPSTGSAVPSVPMEIMGEGKTTNAGPAAVPPSSTETAIAVEESEGKNDERSKEDTSSSESLEEKEKHKEGQPKVASPSKSAPAGEVSKTMESSKLGVVAAKAAPMEAPPAEGAQPSTAEGSKIKDKTVCERLRSILRGEQTIKHHMQFLIKNNHTDMLILKQMKESVRTASAHNATVIANGLMHLGTTTDDFLRDNLEWISKATNWNKFNAVASLGLIHKGHEANALKLLDPYLPKVEVDQFGFKEGGSLYAYGLIHANHGNAEVIAYLRDQLQKATTSAARHGACLGLGLAAMGTHDEQVFVQLRDCLYQDDAVTGEAAGLAMGLVMVGGMQAEAYQEMVQYVCDTQHDKIQRGLRTGIALLAYGQQEEAEKLIAPLLEHKSNAVLRSTAVCMLAMAYAGSGKADVVRRLLAKVAADPNQDVKRFAVIAIGFVLSNDAEQCLSYTGMLVEHFNPHVRYGAAMALGISCAGSGYKEAIALLDPLLSAKENFVRQGAVIALSFILIQQTDAICPKVNEFRKTLTKMITEKGEDSITKLGAILAQGIVDAGGRNVTISLHNRNGHSDMQSVVGTFVFLQYWYWHSLAHFSSLAFKPTCLIGLNLNLEMPKTEFRCNAKPTTFAYPPPLEEKKKEENEKVETAVLSVTHKKKSSVLERPSATAVKEEAKAKEEKMEVDAAPAATTSASDAGAAATAPISTSAAALEHKPSEPKSKEPEPTTYNLQNPARVVRLQLKTLQMPDNSRYKPLKALSQGGIIMLRDKKAGQEKEEIVALAAAGGTRVEGKDGWEEAKPHAPFEINITSY